MKSFLKKLFCKHSYSASNYMRKIGEMKHNRDLIVVYELKCSKCGKLHIHSQIL